MCAMAALGNQAFAISFSAATDGATAPAGATFTSSTGSFSLKTYAGWTTLGTTGGPVGEIPVGQSIKISFAAPQIFNTLTLGRLYDGPEFNDITEIAAVLLSGDVVPFFLKATGTTTASWTGSGVVTNLSPATEPKAAVWQISNPFGNTAVSSLLLYPEPVPNPKNNSDFGLASFNTRQAPPPPPVPEPVTTVASLMAIGGLMLLRRNGKVA